MTTKYPIVLVHGMILKDFRFYRAFRKIRDFLKDEGCRVYVLTHDGIGTMANNAAQMKEMIEKILETEQVEKVNLIAHSKGGVDSRYMISYLDMEDKVASLTTLSSPHHGSKMCAKLLKMPKWMAKFISFWANFWYRIFGDKHPDLYTLATQLTDEYFVKFNEETPNSEKVYYQSYSSDLEHRKWVKMYFSHRFSRWCEGSATDGIVAVESSKWGEYRGNMPDDYDHMEMVAAHGSKKVLESVFQFYKTIVSDLISLGF